MEYVYSVIFGIAYAIPFCLLLGQYRDNKRK